MQRVSVIGVSGAGKTTLSRELARILDCPQLELDSQFQQAGWVPLPTDEFQRRAAAVAAGERWVIDGNYYTKVAKPVVWPRADTVVWLDLPKRIVMRRIVGRTFWRVATRAQMWNGNRERWRNVFSWDPQVSIISWAWHHHGRYRARYEAAVADPENGHLRFVRLTSPGEVRRFLRAAASGSD